MTNDLISRSALLKNECCGRISGDDVRKAPAVDAAPVVHGRWIDRDGKTWCSVCSKPNKAYMPPFCPHCGAKMRGEEDASE